MSVLIGAIADDVTGATDLANTLVKQGMRVVQVLGVPNQQTEIGDAEAVVVALKSRTNPTDAAVAWSLSALEWLRAQGAQQIFFKYCSTFDSTRDGNIGPVADALHQALRAKISFVCPAFPQNGRSIYQGHLFVGRQLLSDSSMRDHPLTPMHESNLVILMQQQSKLKVGLIPHSVVAGGAAAISAAAAELVAQDCSYAVVDAIDDRDLLAIGEAAREHVLVTGGSAIATALPGNFHGGGGLARSFEVPTPRPFKRALVLAGSCSETTRAQIEACKNRWPCYQLNVDRLIDGRESDAEVASWALDQDPLLPVLIYASSTPDEVAMFQSRYGVETAGQLVEQTLGAVAHKLIGQGFDRLIVAGGETSGAVVSALGIKSLRIGPEIDPGVPWTEALNPPGLALALKSGNFGEHDFFIKAFAVLA